MKLRQLIGRQFGLGNGDRSRDLRRRSTARQRHTQPTRADVQQLEARTLLAVAIEALAPGTPLLAYVTDPAADVVRVLDTVTDKVIDSIGVGDSPSWIDVTPDGALVYVGNGNSNDVSVIDTRTRTVIATVPAGAATRQVDVSPAGDKVFVTNHHANTVTVISTATQQKLATIPVGGAPEDTSFSPSGDRAYVANVLSATVSVIDTASLQVVNTIPGFGAGPRGIAITPDGTRGYVLTDWNGGNSFDIAANRVVGSFSVPTGRGHYLSMTPDGSKIYFHQGSGPGDVGVVSTTSNSQIATIPLGQSTVQSEVTPDGTRVYMPGTDATGASVVGIIDTASDTLLRTIPVGTSAHDVAFVPALKPTDCVESPARRVAWWRGDGNANDAVGTNHGTFLGGTTFGPGVIDQAFSFDGVNDFVQVPDSDLWAFGSDDFSIDLWVNHSELRNSTSVYDPQPIYIGNDSGGGITDKWTFTLGGGTLQFQFGSPSIGEFFLVQAPFSPTLNQWYHLAVTRSADTFSLFVDGVIVGSEVNTNAIPNPSAPLTIGQAENTGFMRGRIDEIGIHDRALASHEVAAIYRMQLCGPIPEDEPPIADDEGVLLDEDSPGTIALTATDPEGGEVTFRIADGPMYGTLSEFDPATGDVTYTAEQDWHGLDTFTFVAIDENGLESEPATVYVRVDPVNDEPIADGGATVTDENVPVTVDLWELASDLETPQDELVFAVGDATNGEVELLDDGHTVVFTPEPGYSGPASFAYTVTDTGDPTNEPCDIETEPDCELYSELITVGPIVVEVEVLPPVNDPPVAFDQEVSVREDGSVVVTLGAFDPDGDELTFFIVGEPANGCWEQITESGDAVVYRPHDGFVGSDTLQFFVSDGEFDSEVATVSITVTPLVAGFEFADGVLTVIGTAGNDSIRLLRAGRGYNVVTNFGTFNVPNRLSLVSMVVRGRDGNDTINVAALTATQQAEIRGDGGNDRITAGAGRDIVRGGAGNDTLIGGSGDDLLIGGADSDRLVGSTGHDLLFTGILSDPCRFLDLRALLDEWRSGATADGKLAAAQPVFDVLLDDGNFDMLTGGAGIDLFAWHRLDRIVDRTAADIAVLL